MYVPRRPRHPVSSIPQMSVSLSRPASEAASRRVAARKLWGLRPAAGTLPLAVWRAAVRPAAGVKGGASAALGGLDGAHRHALEVLVPVLDDPAQGVLARPQDRAVTLVVDDGLVYRLEAPP